MPIHFYVSWYLGDPVYPVYSTDCALLLSPTSVSSRWTLRSLSAQPTRLILDSGGFRYSTSSENPPTAADLLHRQLLILDGLVIPTLLCPLDSPVGSGRIQVLAADQQISSTLAHAFELQRIIQNQPLPSHIEPLAIVQGHDSATLGYCARELMSMGYRQFGIGSLARVSDSNDVKQRVAAVFNTVQRPLHLFGISSPKILCQLDSSWVGSVDSSRPAKAAAYNELFYSDPFRRYGIKTRDGIRRSKLPVGRCLSDPLKCVCPVCMSDPRAITRIGKRRHIQSRAVHNYFHLRKTIENLELS